MEQFKSSVPEDGASAAESPEKTEEPKVEKTTEEAPKTEESPGKEEPPKTEESPVKEEPPKTEESPLKEAAEKVEEPPKEGMWPHERRMIWRMQHSDYEEESYPCVYPPECGCDHRLMLAFPSELSLVNAKITMIIIESTRTMIVCGL